MFTDCQSCFSRIMLKRDGTCPACGAKFDPNAGSSKVIVERERVSFVVHPKFRDGLDA